MTAAPVAATTWEGSSPRDWQRLWRLPLLRILDETVSSNDDARELAFAGAPAGTVVIAEHQSAGRGREGRAWDAGSGLSLLLSVVLRPADPASAAPGPTPIRVGLAVCAAIEHCSDLATTLKWPNDVLAPDGRKLAGVLCEAATGGGSSFVVAGIGINVLQTADHWPPHLAPFATSLRDASGRVQDRATLAGALLDRLRPFLLQGPELRADELREFRRRDALHGCAVRVDGSPAGVADGIAPDGALLVRTPTGPRAFRAGTVRLDGASTFRRGRPQPPHSPPQ
jgi:BirA family biotin operon repressor/biotin-[acetyl-CoA-carboxylase] ligase